MLALEPGLRSMIEVSKQKRSLRYMDKKELQNLLEQVAGGQVKPEDALLQIKQNLIRKWALPSWIPTGESVRAWQK